jgi:hypothetical protein
MTVLAVVLGIALSNGTSHMAKHRNFDANHGCTGAEETMMAEERQDCQLLGVDPDGALVVSVAGGTKTFAIFGVEVDAPVPDLYYEIVAKRLPQTGHPLRCTVRSTGPGLPRAQFFYFAWHDKTGEVWQDLAVTLLEQGVVHVGAGDFPERSEYLRHQQAP